MCVHVRSGRYFTEHTAVCVQVRSGRYFTPSNGTSQLVRGLGRIQRRGAGPDFKVEWVCGYFLKELWNDKIPPKDSMKPARPGQA